MILQCHAPTTVTEYDCVRGVATQVGIGESAVRISLPRLKFKHGSTFVSPVSQTGGIDDIQSNTMKDFDGQKLSLSRHISARFEGHSIKLRLEGGEDQLEARWLRILNYWSKVFR